MRVEFAKNKPKGPSEPPRVDDGAEPAAKRSKTEPDDGKTIFVGGLPAEVDEQQLLALFAGAVAVRFARGRSRALVDFDSAEARERALQQPAPLINNQQLVVAAPRPPTERRATAATPRREQQQTEATKVAPLTSLVPRGLRKIAKK